jgi:hypothetical protein
LNFVEDTTVFKVFQAPVISLLNCIYATYSNLRILRVMLSVWSDITSER